MPYAVLKTVFNLSITILKDAIVRVEEEVIVERPIVLVTNGVGKRGGGETRGNFKTTPAHVYGVF